ncbi:hypothetical protein [Salipiger marinus]|uniref:Flagellar FliJ protein n=1 Tax=Salipiger marinus TaxID=555512 RepID=A0A1G8NDB3_9RHOB|nr:hypothetical protein [Salipiger marinus]SDI78249.1 hypothetical protein SAMN04487993_10102 [Salipiger marinus]
MTGKTSDLGELRHITSLLRARALEDVRRERLEEDRLRAEQGEIDRMREAARSAAQAVSLQRLIGADTLWQGWLTSRRMEINRQMAMVRARQAHHLAVARLAFSRDEAVASLQSRERQARQSDAERQQAQKLEALLFLRRLQAVDQAETS